MNNYKETEIPIKEEIKKQDSQTDKIIKKLFLSSSIYCLSSHMKRFLGMDETYNELQELGFFDNSMLNFSLSLIEKYCKTVVSIDENDKYFQEICQILRKYNKISLQSFKFLIFHHISINLLFEDSSEILSQSLQSSLDQIKSILQKQSSRLKSKTQKANKSRTFSLEKTTNWIRNTLSRSKDKREDPIENKRAKSRANTNGSSFQSPKLKEKIEGKQIIVNDKQEVLIQKIIIPYGTYLLKLINYKQAELTRGNDQTDLNKTWKRVNLLTYLLKISEQFPLILRYFSNHYKFIVEALIKMINNDLKNEYTKIDKLVSQKYQLIKNEVLAIYEKNQSHKKKIELLQQVIKKHGVLELKQIFEEISKINELILVFYLGKYTYPLIKENCLVQPQIIGSTCNQFELVYQILDDISKNKSASRRSSKSKQRQISITEQNAKYTQLKNSISQAKSIFAQKKLKIISTDQKNDNASNINWNRQQRKNVQQGKHMSPKFVQQIKKKQQEYKKGNQSAFTKLRAKMTNSINRDDDSNNRKLRL